MNEVLKPGDLVRHVEGSRPIVILDIIEFRSGWRLASVVLENEVNFVDIKMLRRWDGDDS